MTRHCAISVDVTGVEPALGPLNGHILVGGRTPFADAGSAGFGVAQTPTAYISGQDYFLP